MRLLVDAQLPPTLTQSFVSKGHDAVHVAVCDESLPSRPLKLDFLRMATIAEVEKLALDLQETERAVLQHTYWDRFHRSCTMKMKVSQKLCVAMRSLRRIHSLACH